MRAALIKAFGEPTEVLELADVPEPSAPAEGEVLVGVEYAPINMNDLYVIQGAFPVRPSLPSIVGNEGVGRVSGPPQAMACRFDAAALYSVPHQEWG
jgi:NADPH:quinone reductase-like Zn-dependent oxidoreductase